jgi:hypothetical protein
VDTPECSETILDTALTEIPKQTNRTIVIEYTFVSPAPNHLRQADIFEGEKFSTYVQACQIERAIIVHNISLMTLLM